MDQSVRQWDASEGRTDRNTDRQQTQMYRWGHACACMHVRMCARVHDTCLSICRHKPANTHVHMPKHVSVHTSKHVSCPDMCLLRVRKTSLMHMMMLQSVYSAHVLTNANVHDCDRSTCLHACLYARRAISSRAVVAHG